MPIERFFLSESLLNKKVIHFDQKESHHLKVMRMREGETIEIINGQGEIAQATLEDFSKAQVTASLSHIRKEQPLSPPLTIIQGLTRQNHLDFLIEKGTELGVTSFFLFIADRSEKKSITPSLIQRLKNISIASIKQCGSLYLPDIQIFPSIHQLTTLIGDPYFGDLRPHTPPFSTHLRKDHPLSFFIGPEKGFSDSEIYHLETQIHAKGVSLHLHTLRAETVVTTVATLFRHI